MDKKIEGEENQWIELEIDSELVQDDSINDDDEMEIIALSELNETELEIEHQLALIEEKEDRTEEIANYNAQALALEEDFRATVEAIVQKKHGKRNRFKYECFLRVAEESTIIVKNGPIIILIACIDPSAKAFYKTEFWRSIEDKIEKFPRLQFNTSLVRSSEVRETKNHLYKGWHLIPEDKFEQKVNLIPSYRYTVDADINITMRDRETGLVVKKSGKYSEFGALEDCARLELSRMVYDFMYLHGDKD